MRVCRQTIGGLGAAALVVLAAVLGCQKPSDGKTDAAKSDGRKSVEAEPIVLVNVSYDPTRELYTDFNKAFKTYWAKKTGQQVEVKMSHDGSGKQARNVIAGMPTDVVTLALAYDVDSIRRKAGLLAEGWQKKLPDNSAPYTSTIVFLVRKGNPKQIKDWDDLVKPGVKVIMPNPKTSGGARWNYLAAWGYALKRELGDLKRLHDPNSAEAVARAQQKAQEFVRQVLAHVEVFDAGARGSTMTFVQRGIGDVLLAWENEAFLSAEELGADKFETVVPSISILAEPTVAVVDKNVDKRGTRKVAEAYLNYLYSPEGQTIAAKRYYRPRDEKSVPAKYLAQFPKIELFTIDDVFGGWEKAQPQHFNDRGVCDQIMKR